MRSLSLICILASGCLFARAASAQSVDTPVRPAWQIERLMPWTPYIDEASHRFGIPRNWIEGVILAESGGRATRNGQPVRSRAGAIGLMQLMPATYADMRIPYGLGDNPDDPRDNILAGTAYLRRMYDLYNYPGLFAAYNAGPARYEASLRGVKLPEETRLYLAELTRKSPALASGPTLFVALSPVQTDEKAPEKPALFVVLSETQTPEN